jgi:hypothetical protein
MAGRMALKPVAPRTAGSVCAILSVVSVNELRHASATEHSERSRHDPPSRAVGSPRAVVDSAEGGYTVQADPKAKWTAEIRAMPAFRRTTRPCPATRSPCRKHFRLPRQHHPFYFKIGKRSGAILEISFQRYLETLDISAIHGHNRLPHEWRAHRGRAAHGRSLEREGNRAV